MTARARDQDAKLARRDDILQAARRLFLLDDRQLPSVARIACEAGLAKGTVYLYFQTKEEIFIALLGDELNGLLDGIAHAPQPGMTVQAQLQHFLQLYVGYLDQHPELLRLDAMAYSVLEQNLGDEQLRAFKLELVHRLQSAGTALDQAFGLPAGRSTTLLIRTYALTRGLWQSLDYPPALQALLADPIFSAIRPPFRDELVAALAEYWRGALSDTE